MTDCKAIRNADGSWQCYECKLKWDSDEPSPCLNEGVQLVMQTIEDKYERDMLPGQTDDPEKMGHRYVGDGSFMEAPLSNAEREKRGLPLSNAEREKRGLPLSNAEREKRSLPGMIVGLDMAAVDLTPGAINYGGIDRQGRKLIGTHTQIVGTPNSEYTVLSFPANASPSILEFALMFYPELSQYQRKLLEMIDKEAQKSKRLKPGHR